MENQGENKFLRNSCLMIISDIDGDITNYHNVEHYVFNEQRLTIYQEKHNKNVATIIPIARIKTCTIHQHL